MGSRGLLVGGAGTPPRDLPIEQRHSESMDIKSGVVYSWVVDLFILLSLGQRGHWRQRVGQ